MGGVEAAGDVLTGAVIGRAVEPGHGETAGEGHGACANCGTALQGGFCHVCGQNAHVHRSIGGIGHEIAHGVFHFEGKVWRTLPMLALKPGRLTRRYIHGERARFVSPMALFLFAVFLTFAVFETVGGPVRTGGNNINVSTAVPLAQSRTDLADLLAEREQAVKQGQPTAKLDRRIASERDDIAGLEKADSYVMGEGKIDDDNININTGSKLLDDRVKEAVKNPKLLLYKLQSSAYKYAWALIVLSLPFMWLMFPLRRDVHIYDHAIFVTYSLSAIMLLLIVMAFIATTGVATWWLLLLFPVHLFVQLRGAYLLGRWSALWRTTALLIASSVVLAGFVTLLLVLGLMA